VGNCFEDAEKGLICSYGQHKSVPQRLKPSRDHGIFGTAEEAAEKLGFVSGHDFSRAVND
jgi:hypothetical protein